MVFDVVQVGVVVECVVECVVVDGWCFLCYVCDLLGRWDGDFVVVGVQFVVQYGKQCGFVVVVYVDKVDLFIGVEGGGGVVEQYFGVVLEDEVVELDYEKLCLKVNWRRV